MHPLITTDQAAAALTRRPPGARPVLLDVRWRLAGPPGADSYRDGHLPGAVFLELGEALAGPPGAGGRHPLPDPGTLQRALRAAGVSSGTPVIVYDDADGSVAARGWWLLRWAGHREVAVLDGGFAAWVADGLPVTTEVPRPEAGDLTVRPGGMPVLDSAQAGSLARTGVLLDARAPGRYAGDEEPVDPRAGHIPGARSAPFAGHLGQDGRWRPAAELAARFRELGVEAGAPVGAYCGSGVTATSVVLALELAGHESPAALYPGSWSQWSADPGLPAALGPEPG